MGHPADSRSSSRPSASRIALAVLLVAGLAAAFGAIGGMLGVQPVILWAILFPLIFRFVWLFFGRERPAAAPAVPSGTVLLDATARARRLVQVFLPVVGVIASTVGVSQLVRADIATPGWAAPAVMAGILAIIVALVLPISWETSYKGHRIRFDNYPCLAERLFIDGVQVDRGGVGVNMVLHGAIAAGDGAGERIVAQSHAGLLAFSCRIVAEPNAAARV